MKYELSAGDGGDNFTTLMVTPINRCSTTAREGETCVVRPGYRLERAAGLSVLNLD